MRHRLGNLAFVVRKFEVHSAAVDVKCLAEVFLAHHRAFEVPAGKAVAPGALPVHYVFGRGFFPEGEVGGVVLLGLSVKSACGSEELLDVSA